MPPPQPNEKDSWWPLLANDKKNVLTVFASMPFEVTKTGRSNARNAMPMGVAVGKLYPELTGDDYSFLTLQCVHVPEAEMRRLLGKAGYKVRQLLAVSTGRGGSAPDLVPRRDRRLCRPQRYASGPHPRDARQPACNTSPPSAVTPHL